MLQAKEIFQLLNKKEKRNFCILIMLMILNSAFEILGITSIIPIISITIKNDLSLFEGMFFFDYLKEFSEKENYLVFSGIGNHHTFISMLKINGIKIVKELEFPDHYEYSEKDINKILRDNKDLDKFLENITIIEKDLVNIFEKNNIKKIHAKGEKFDPNFHQAMAEIEDDKSDPGKIVQEIQSGYMLGDRLLRPSLVGISKKKTSKDQENKDKKDEK